MLFTFLLHYSFIVKVYNILIWHKFAFEKPLKYLSKSAIDKINTNFHKQGTLIWNVIDGIKVSKMKKVTIRFYCK